MALALHLHCIVIVIGIVGRGVHTNRSRVATFGRRRGELPPQLGVFFREALQLRGRVRLVLSAFGLRIEHSVFNAIIFIVIGILVLTVGRIE